MQRYVVIDTHWEDGCPAPMGLGRQVGSFVKPDSAKALALQFHAQILQIDQIAQGVGDIR